MNELPLLELFTRLRELGLPLGIRDYEAVLQALQAGYGLPDRAALARLCRTLWVRSSDERQLFDCYFEQLIDREIVLTTNATVEPVISGETVSGKETPIIPTKSNKQPRAIPIAVYAGAIGVLLAVAGVALWLINRPQTPQITPSPSPIPTKPSPTTPSPTASSPTTPSPTTPSPTSSIGKEQIQPTWRLWDVMFFLMLCSGSVWLFIILMQRRKTSSEQPIPSPVESSPKLTSELMRAMGDEVLAAQVMQQMTMTGNPRSSDRFVLSADYLPVTQRQMKQSWRHLRRMVREGRATELDLEQTVRQIASKGMLLEPVLVPRRVNRTELVLLIDRDGSMVAFHALADRSIETALMGGKLGKAGTYYFHNCPVGYLYHDRVHSESEPVAEVLAKLQRDRTVVLIFSDAGAARGGLNHDRVERTIKFLQQLQAHVRYVAWLNPMPKSRWQGTTAAEIAREVPMFDSTREGLDRAIDVLRGKHIRGIDRTELTSGKSHARS